MADDDYSFLAGLSAHPGRQGDTSNFNPAFASALANAIRQARAAGLPVGIESGFRPPGLTGSAYDAGGNSSHSYGLASDISGLDGPNGKVTQAWAKIAQANGLHNPYGTGNKAEFNHWQFTAQPLEQMPQLLASLKKAAASGNMSAVWTAFNNATQPTAVAYANPPSSPAASSPAAAAINASAAPVGQPAAAQPTSQRDQHIQFIRDYANKIGLDPNLALGIANAEGLNAWTAKNPGAGSYVDRDAQGRPYSWGDFQLNTRGGMGVDALKAGINPADPNQWQAADQFALDRMKAGGVGPWSDPFAREYAKTGTAPPFTAGTTINTAGGPAAGSQTGNPSGASGAAAGGNSPASATGQPAQPQTPLGRVVAALQPNSPTMQGLGKALGVSQGGSGGGPGGGDEPPPFRLDPIQPAMPVGGPMMIGPGGQNTVGRTVAQQQGLPSLLAQQLGLGKAQMPMADAIGNPVKIAPGQAGLGVGLPGTTLNSPSQLQLALQTGMINPYDIYGGLGQGGGSYGQ